MGKIVDLARKRFWNTEIFELIESELQKLDEKAGNCFDGLFSTMRDRLRQQDKQIEELSATVSKGLREQAHRSGALKQDILNLFKMLAQRTKCIRTLEKEVHGHHRRLYEIEEKQIKDQSRIMALEDIHQGRLTAEILEKARVPTDKDRPFQVGDTIELCGGGLRIVLVVKPDRSMELLDVETGDRWWTSQPKLYTLVYRPGLPKPESTIKEEIDTDRFGKPPGGLEEGDMISSVLKNDYGIFHRAEGHKIWGHWKQGYAWVDKSFVTFEFRPRFPSKLDIKSPNLTVTKHEETPPGFSV